MLNTINSLFLCLVGYLVFETNSSAVSFITPCKRGDDKCILAVAQPAIPLIAAGIPELGIPVSDPFFIDSVRADDKNLKLGFRNIQIFGVAKCKMNEIHRDTEKNTINVVVQCPIKVVGQYDVNGKILFLEVSGDGDFTIETDNVKISVEIKIKEIEKNGKKYWKVTGFDYSYDLLKKVYLNLKNLFGGDEERAKPFNAMLDNSGNEIIEEVGGPLITKLIGNFVEVINKLFRAISVDQLELP